MPYFPSLGDNATVPDILKMAPAAGIALTTMTETVMRGPSPLSAGEREVIASYVSGLNDCRYCYGVHSACAEAYGTPRAVMDKWYDDLEGSGIDAKLLPLLQVAHVLTREPANMSEALAQTVYDAGWDEQALHDAITVTGVFNMYNRFLEGHGVHGNEAMYKERGPMLKEFGYLPLNRLLEPLVEAAGGR